MGYELRKISTLMRDGMPCICVEIQDNQNGTDQWRMGVETMDIIISGMQHHGMTYSGAYHYTAEPDWNGARLFFTLETV